MMCPNNTKLVRRKTLFFLASGYYYSKEERYFMSKFCIEKDILVPLYQLSIPPSLAKTIFSLFLVFLLWVDHFLSALCASLLHCLTLLLW